MTPRYPPARSACQMVGFEPRFWAGEQIHPPWDVSTPLLSAACVQRAAEASGLKSRGVHVQERYMRMWLVKQQVV